MDFEDLSELDVSLRTISDEFHYKISHDFQNLIFLGLREQSTKELEEVMKMAVTRDGYAAHKAFSYKERRVSHIYIRFRNAACAEKAIVYFRATDKKFNADIVKNILLTWYMIERTFYKTTEWTSTYVDIQGKSEMPNPLSISNVKPLLLPFGCFRILHSNKSFPRSVQVLFTSMAEALAATIAVGGWSYKDGVNNPQSSYRVRIVGQSKEAKMFEYCGSSSQEAFEMDYFVPASEVEAEYDLPKGNDDWARSSQILPGRQSSYRGNFHGRGRHGGKHHCPDPRLRVPLKSTPDSNEIHDGEKEMNEY